MGGSKFTRSILSSVDTNLSTLELLWLANTVFWRGGCWLWLEVSDLRNVIIRTYFIFHFIASFTYRWHCHAKLWLEGQMQEKCSLFTSCKSLNCTTTRVRIHMPYSIPADASLGSNPRRWTFKWTDLYELFINGHSTLPSFYGSFFMVGVIR